VDEELAKTDSNFYPSSRWSDEIDDGKEKPPYRRYQTRSEAWNNGTRYVLEMDTDESGSDIDFDIRIRRLSPEKAVLLHDKLRRMLEQLHEEFGGDEIKRERS